MVAPPFDGIERADVAEAVLQGLSEGRFDGCVPCRQPLLQNAAGTQMATRNLIELGGVQKAGAGGLNGRRRIDDNYVEGIAGAFEEAAGVVDDDPRVRGTHQPISVRMKITEK